MVTRIPFSTYSSISVIPHPAGTSALLVEKNDSPNTKTRTEGIYYVGDWKNRPLATREAPALVFDAGDFGAAEHIVTKTIKQALPEPIRGQDASFCIYRVVEMGELSQTSPSSRNGFFRAREASGHHHNFADTADHLVQRGMITREMVDKAVAAVTAPYSCNL